jgi:penicillin amidase
VPSLVAAATRGGAGARPEVRSLATWNFHMAKDAHAPMVFEAWSSALDRLVADSVYPREVARVLRDRVSWSVVDSVLRAGGRGDALAVAALDSAVATLTRRLGPNAASQPGERPHRRDETPDRRRSICHPRGAGNTVMATAGANFRQTAGASYREIIDLADFDNSVAINVPGQSAQPESPHYADLLTLWGRGEYFPLVYSRARVEKETKHILILGP